MDLVSQLVLGALVAVAIGALILMHHSLKDWRTRKDHEYRVCGLEKEFEQRRLFEQQVHEQAMVAMQKGHELNMARDEAHRAANPSPAQIGGYS